MKTAGRKRRVLAFSLTLLVSVSTLAQAPGTNNLSLQLGDKVVVLPAPDGFEEAASQFEIVKTRMSATEDPGNDMLAVHLPAADCEKFRRGDIGPLTFYTKVSIRKGVRARDYSEVEFKAIPAEFQKGGAEILDIKGPRLKASIDRAERVFSEMSEGKTKIGIGQPENLGEFDNRQSVYGFMLMMNITVQSGDRPQVIPLLTTVSFVRVKQRLLYVYGYRRYESKRDIEILRDFATRWVTSILAAN